MTDRVLVWLIHPVTVAGTALLIVNDHVLKAAYPGWLTGKLSDVAGLVMTPPLLALLLALGGRLAAVLRTSWGFRGRRAGDLLAVAAIVVVGVGFTAVKATAAGAATASAAWSAVNGPSVILADVTDLLALPALGLAWWAWRSAAVRPTVARWLRMVAVLVVLPIAGLGVAATSAPVYDDAVTLYEWRGAAVVGIGNAYHGDREPDRWQVSRHDGPTFAELPAGGYEMFVEQPPPAASGEDCSTREPGHCFRVVPRRLAVEESRDGGATWRVAWQVDEDARQRLAVTMPAMDDVEEYLSSRALLVRDQPDGGVVVLVANGRDGLARRDGAGRWERIGFGTLTGDGLRQEVAAQPIPSVAEATVTAGWRVAAPLSIVVGSFVALVGCATLLVRRHGRLLLTVTVPAGLLNLLGLAVFTMYAMAGANSDELLAPLMIVGTLLGLAVAPAGAIVLTVVVVKPLRAIAGWICAAGLLAGAVVWLPYLLRLLTNWPPQRTLTLHAVATTLAVLLVSVPAVIRHAARLDR
ncbi:hypothetical protein GCM10011608_21270 [Micromonospora sonchi]|uniref:Uncharacterized protein n=1 Tax=Micromonospora sonchi TaxID=1763543 RepID=A0A917TT90_9ACTN|nr:hypothetical protein [Micromonospora sonchi]GGM36386.1 hypothetical protein GCM10011608_21270 [Micromonospora sonchi]